MKLAKIIPDEVPAPPREDTAAMTTEHLVNIAVTDGDAKSNVLISFDQRGTLKTRDAWTRIADKLGFDMLACNVVACVAKARSADAYKRFAGKAINGGSAGRFKCCPALELREA